VAPRELPLTSGIMGGDVPVIPLVGASFPQAAFQIERVSGVSRPPAGPTVGRARNILVWGN